MRRGRAFSSLFIFSVLFFFLGKVILPTMLLAYVSYPDTLMEKTPEKTDCSIFSGCHGYNDIN